MDQTNQTKRGNGDLTVPCDMSNNASMMKLPHQKKHKMGATDTNNETQSLEQVQGIPASISFQPNIMSREASLEALRRIRMTRDTLDGEGNAPGRHMEQARIVAGLAAAATAVSPRSPNMSCLANHSHGRIPNECNLGGSSPSTDNGWSTTSNLGGSEDSQRKRYLSMLLNKAWQEAPLVATMPMPPLTAPATNYYSLPGSSLESATVPYFATWNGHHESTSLHGTLLAHRNSQASNSFPLCIPTTLNMTNIVAEPIQGVQAIPNNGTIRTLPALLSHPSDGNLLSAHNVLLRLQIEAFFATELDISTHTRGRNKTIYLRQVGIRCKHCAHLPVLSRQKGSTYFPASVMGIYQAAQNIGSTHIQSGLCVFLPFSTKQQFAQTVPMRSKYSGGGRSYWAKCAQEMGLVDTDKGMFHIVDVEAAR